MMRPYCHTARHLTLATAPGTLSVSILIIYISFICPSETLNRLVWNYSIPEITERKLIIHFQHSVIGECPAASDLFFQKTKLLF